MSAETRAAQFAPLHQAAPGSFHSTVASASARGNVIMSGSRTSVAAIVFFGSGCGSLANVLPLRAEARLATDRRHGRRKNVKKSYSRVIRWGGPDGASRAKEMG